jgi:quercetin dioxygenase-like cupin family protein
MGAQLPDLPGGPVPVPAPFEDARGRIQNLVDTAFGSGSVIFSVKGAVRGNHYHRSDFHFCWLLSGSMVYLQRPAGSSAPPQRWTIKPGQLFYTPPEAEHAMLFTDDSVMIVLARNGRDMAEYERDIIRVAPLGP